jgi:hypothetical protein
MIITTILKATEMSFPVRRDHSIARSNCSHYPGWSNGHRCNERLRVAALYNRASYPRGAPSRR